MIIIRMTSENAAKRTVIRADRTKWSSSAYAATVDVRAVMSPRDS